jgi:1-acyl-sn-glycerol-3-phosphate acyltransferase
MRTVFLLVIYVVLVLLIIPFFLICFLIQRREPILAYGKWAMGVGRRALGIQIELSGVDDLHPKTPYIFMANHESFLDGPLLFRLIPQPVRVILKKSIFRIPMVGLGMHFVGFIPVDRKGIRGGKIAIDRASRLMKEKGYSFLIFPEGTRSRTGKLQPFRRGGFFLAVESRAAIVPVTIRGTFELMPKGQFFVKKGNVQVSFLEPVEVGTYGRENVSELMDKIHRIFERALGVPDARGETS